MDEDLFTNDEIPKGASNLVLSEIEAWVAANNTRLQAQMIKANSGQSAVFLEGTIATLQIPAKLRLKTKPSWLPVWVIEYKNGQYKLQSKHGRLSGQYQGRQLNLVDQATADIFGGSIRPAPEKKVRASYWSR